MTLLFSNYVYRPIPCASVTSHIATGECFASLLQISVGRHRGENNRGQGRQNARLISLLFVNLIVSVCAL